MRPIIYALVAVLTVVGSSRGEDNGEKGWVQDFEKAMARAAKEEKLIIADFTGSDWCGWCIKLDKEVFSQDTFKDFARDNVVLFKADFPMRKEQPKDIARQNKKLAETYRVQGFPTILLLNAEGKQLERTGYRPGGAEKYVEHLKALISAHEEAIPRKKVEETAGS